jgi:hypothetical protein
MMAVVDSTSRIGRPIIQPRLLYLCVLAFLVSMSARLLGWCNAPCGASTSKDGAINLDVLRQYNDVNKRLVQHDDSVGLNISFESERRYSFIDIAQSDMIADMFHQKVVEQSTKMLLERHLESKEFCIKHAGNDHVLDSGGWCLTPGNTASITWKDNTFMIPHNHVLASGRIASELLTFIEQENITSINDFGAGVGQYKHAILSKLPDVMWESYDGAGNTEEYTKGFVHFVDLTLPLELPKADWVVSLEVGEHVSGNYEGMVIRNLHHHNCKGVILSWAVLGQGGHSHVNNHSNDYIISLFKELGYKEDLDLKDKLRNPEDNYYWFPGSTMVFRRIDTSPSLGCSRKDSS